MRQDWNEPDRSPTPEQVAAFVDGELDPVNSAWVEGWLTDHPDMAGEAEAWRRLARMWAETAPPDPGPAAWATTRARIDAALPARAPTHLRVLRRSVWANFALMAAAAALAFVLLGRPSGPAGSVDEPFPVASSEDVTVVSMAPRDADALVVGHPPVLGDFEIAAPTDVRVVNVAPAEADGSVGRLVEVGPVPMIVPAPGQEP